MNNGEFFSPNHTPAQQRESEPSRGGCVRERLSLSRKSLASRLLQSRPVSKEALGDFRLCDLFMEPVALVT